MDGNSQPTMKIVNIHQLKINVWSLPARTISICGDARWWMRW